MIIIIVAMNRQYQSLYFTLRSMYKWIIRFLSGETEIERVARRHDLNALEYSLSHSKVLFNFTHRHCNWEEAYSQDLINELCELKHISSTDSKFRIAIAFKQLFCWKHAIKTIEKFRQTKYDSASSEHEEKLIQIWERLRPLRSLKARKSVEWIELGFQADDPATDFRGSGLLGLLTLHAWVGQNEGKESFLVADTKGTDYFFASASIFLTMLTVQLVRERYIPASFWVDRPEESLLLSFQKIFNEVFREFNLFWSTTQDKSMMQFNMNLLAFSNKMKVALVGGVYERINND